MKEIKRNFSKWMYWFMLAVAIILVYKFLDNFMAIGSVIGKFFKVIKPFLFGLLIAYLLYIPASKIEESFKKCKNRFVRKKSKGLSVMITVLIALIMIIILVNVIWPVITESVIELASNLQGYLNNAIDNFNALPEDSILKSDKVKEGIYELKENIQQIDIRQYINTEKITGYVQSVIGFASGIFSVFVTIVVSIYILLERDNITKFLKKMGNAILNEKTYSKMEKYLNSSNKIFFKFISSQLLDAVIVGILVTVAMSIIGVKYSVLLGFIIGLFNVIPYFGAIIAVAISVIITLITGGLSQTIIMSIVVIILQQIDSNIINPKIMGNSLEISPLLVIFAVTVGGEYFGVLGMFFAVPVAAIIKIIINDYISFKEEEKIFKINKQNEINRI